MEQPTLIGTFYNIRVFDTRHTSSLVGLTAGDVAISESLDGHTYASRLVWDGSRANDLNLRGIDYDIHALLAAEAANEQLLAVQ